MAVNTIYRRPEQLAELMGTLRACGYDAVSAVNVTYRYLPLPTVTYRYPRYDAVSAVNCVEVYGLNRWRGKAAATLLPCYPATLLPCYPARVAREGGG